METAIEFSHNAYHRLSVCSLIVMSGLCGVFVAYAALSGPPSNESQWLPAVLDLIAWLGCIHFIGMLKVLGNSFRASHDGLRVISGSTKTESFFRWNEVAEVDRYSSTTGMGSIRVGTPPHVYRFINSDKKAEAFAAFAFDRCAEAHGA